ncbi:MAG: hypothetical protein A4S09_04215 [Proteobacteria bacterium SG_bin7]|nr:MAG: hypothetical protein A4S09_04215 [Proteobacteria bacterium SG_bin7]
MAKKSSSKDIWQKFLNIFITPYFLGIVITIVAVKMTMVYFYEKDSTRQDKSSTYKMLNWVNQKGLDFQFWLRQERPVSDDIALITVDEKAVEQEGRWPWPRIKIKRIIENLIRDGAKVVGFDAIFADEDLNATVLSLRELKNNLPPSAHAAVDAQLAKANTDSDLAEAVKTYAPNLVMGVYFENDNNISTYQNLCFSVMHRESAVIKNWERVQEPVLALDKATGLLEEETPEPWANILTAHKKALEEGAINTFLRAHNVGDVSQLNNTQTVELKNKVRHEVDKYCLLRFLTKEDEKLKDFAATWPLIASSLENSKMTFEEAAFQIQTTHRLNPIVPAYDFAFNYSGITQNLLHMGYFNAFQDSDGTIRRSALIARFGNNYFPSLALKSFLVAMGFSVNVNLGPDDIDPTQKNVTGLRLLKEGEPAGEIPVSKKGELLINFAGPQKMFPHVSIADILNDSTELTYEQNEYDPKYNKWIPKLHKAKKAEYLKNKILLLGATATGIYDLRVTPFQENYPGLETHANILDNLLQQNYYVARAQETQIVPMLFGVGILFSLLFGYLGAFWGFFWAATGTLGYIFYDKVFLFSKGIVFPLFFPILLLGVLYLTITVFKYFTEERNKKQLKSTFQKYVSPAIVNEILSDPGKLELGGRKQKMTVFFSDVRGFTTISEKLDPRALSDLLNSYLTPMTDLVFKNRGTLDKYMGDAVMAFFGAPVPYPDHAAWACRCALEQLQKLFQLQAEYRKQGLPEIDIGIGLNTGEMSVGNMGSETVRNYTVMGDAVNLGSRLEGINKQYGTRIIISEFTEAELKGKFVTRELDWVKVKGKLKPVKIFELIAEGKPNPDLEKTLKHFSDGYEMYHKMQWEKAAEHFNRALESKPDDGPSKLYLERCLEYKAEPPPSDWDGVFVMKTK